MTKYASNDTMRRVGEAIIEMCLKERIQPIQIVDLSFVMACFIAIGMRMDNITRLELEDTLISKLKEEFERCFNSQAPHNVFAERQKAEDNA